MTKIYCDICGAEVSTPKKRVIHKRNYMSNEYTICIEYDLCRNCDYGLLVASYEAENKFIEDKRRSLDADCKQADN